MVKKKIVIIGTGKMGGALIKGLISASVSSKDIMASDKDKAKLMPFNKKIKTTADNFKAVKWGEVIILCIKPKDIDGVLKEIASGLYPSQHKLFISIAAGITTDFIEKRLGKVPVIRAMPNTPAIIREGISAISLGRFARSRHEHIARAIFRSLGDVLKISERDMDAITALSGSGPAYFFFLIEVLTEAGKRMGISSKDSLSLTLQVAKGAALLAKESGIPPARLREMVTSKGGVTEAAFKTLEKRKVRGAFIQAVIRAQKRSKELNVND